VFAPSLALAGDLAREGESGTTLSVLTMGFGFGVAVGPLASGWLVGFGFVVPLRGRRRARRRRTRDCRDAGRGDARRGREDAAAAATAD